MKTFAEKLKEHTNYCNKIMKQTSKFILLSKEAKKEGNDKNYVEFMEQAEKSIKLADETMREFETNHGKELTILEEWYQNKYNEQ